ncbi:MAG: methyltransferase [Cyclobacteriaceae bacterium]
MMASKPFHFKQFTVGQNSATHKVGTDGVLLGAWVQVAGEINNILDIGTGSGLITLMLAQRTAPATRIEGIEIAEQDVLQARENVQHSPWPQKIIIHHIAVQKFFPQKKYDLIVSNPPYFINSWLPPEKKRSQARHTQSLSFESLLASTARLLASQGRLAVILPFVEGSGFIDLADKFQLFLNRKTSFRSRSHKPVERLLLEFSFSQTTIKESDLVLYSEGETWSEAHHELTREFYLER